MDMDMDRDEGRLGRRGVVAILGLAAATLGMGLGGAGRLTYHEAIWAQSARELIAAGDPLVPTLDGRPWLEKPPGGTWPIALVGRIAGRVDEGLARAPSAVAATLLALAVATLGARRSGAGVGVLAGAIQLTTLWAVMRGRLAEPDILLAAAVAWGIVAFDRVRAGGSGRWRWAFFGLLGLTALFKGIGFGAALLGAALLPTLARDRDRAALRRLATPGGWALAAGLALAWPLLVVAREPAALGLWTMHVVGRFAAHPRAFAGDSRWEYALAPLWQTLPWTPLALLGAWRSWRRAARGRGGPDRLLWGWAIAPAALVSLATVRNAHYLIYALPPWSIWAAQALALIGDRLRARGWSADSLRRGAAGGFAAAGVAIGLGYALIGPAFDRRGAEWAFYEAVGRGLPAGEPLVLLYDDWDRLPYPSPFGPMPHDLAVRLFYLGRPATWRASPRDLADRPPAPPGEAFAVIGRDRDLPALRLLGNVQELARGPDLRQPMSRVDDRAFRLYRVTPGPDRVARAPATPLPRRY